MTDAMNEELRRIADADAPRRSAEEDLVRRVGDQIGYGRVMQLAEEIWNTKTPGAAFSSGPCLAFLVPCPHAGADNAVGCAWCCGAGRVTERVREAMLAAGSSVPARDLEDARAELRREQDARAQLRVELDHVREERDDARRDLVAAMQTIEAAALLGPANDEGDAVEIEIAAAEVVAFGGFEEIEHDDHEDIFAEHCKGCQTQHLVEQFWDSHDAPSRGDLREQLEQPGEVGRG